MSDAAPTGPPGTARAPQVHATAPGRVNLIGEHTDYNDGYVLPVPIPQQTRVVLSERSDRQVVVHSDAQAEPGRYALGAESVQKSWLDYVQGVTWVLRQAGQQINGFDAHVASSVPMGAGLSSSAALEVALLRALRQAFLLQLSDLDVARLARAVEVEFVGVPIGIMDQMASSLGTAGQALFIDTRTLQTRDVAIPEDLELVVIASGVVHAHDASGYRERRDQCAQAGALLGVAALRDATLEQLERCQGLSPLLLRRARHVVTENQRVLDTIDALASSDRSRLRGLFAASHASMRDDYEVSVPQIDLLVALAEQTPGIIGARLTGGGFGGSVVMLAERGQALDAARSIVREYEPRTGLTATILLPLE